MISETDIKFDIPQVPCGWWHKDSCHRFQADCDLYEVCKNCKTDKRTCEWYEPIFNKENIRYILNKLYKEAQEFRSDKAIYDYKYMAGHGGDFIGDCFYWEWAVNTYVLMLRNSKLCRKNKGHSGQDQVEAIELMRQYGYKITKRMKRRYRRIKKRCVQQGIEIIDYVTMANTHLDGHFEFERWE